MVSCPDPEGEEGRDWKGGYKSTCATLLAVLVSFPDLDLLRSSLGTRLLVAHFWTPPLLLSMTLWWASAMRLMRTPQEQ